MRLLKVKVLIPLTGGSWGLWDLFFIRGRGAMEGEEREKKNQTNQQTNPVDFHQRTWSLLLAGSPASTSLIKTKWDNAGNIPGTESGAQCQFYPSCLSCRTAPQSRKMDQADLCLKNHSSPALSPLVHCEAWQSELIRAWVLALGCN